MKNNITKILFAFLVLAVACSAQTALTTTTLTAAITSTYCAGLPNGCYLTVASATGITGSGQANQINTALYIDRELFWVNSVVGTTIYVQRGKGVGASARPTTHANGATVYIGPPAAFKNDQATAENYGSCTASAEQFMPKIYIYTGDIMWCGNTSSGGQWLNFGLGTMATNVGRTISAFCTGTAGSAETEFLNGAACSGATTSTFRYVVQTAGTLANLQVYSSAAVTGGTGKDVLTVLKNGTATTITCTIAASGTSCTDGGPTSITGHSVATVPGDVITFRFVSATSDTATNVSASLGLY